MNPSSPAKIGLAFAAGLVVALGSVVIYLKTSGPQAHEAGATAAVQQVRQPDNLNAGKAETAAPPVSAPVAAAAPTPAPVQPTPITPEVRHTAARSHAVRRSTAPQTQGGIRVEVSQMNQPTQPVSAPIPMPTGAPPVRTVNEDQTQTGPQPPTTPQYSAPVAAPPPPPQPRERTGNSCARASSPGKAAGSKSGWS